MFVRFCQPFLVSGIVLAFYLVYPSPLNTSEEGSFYSSMPDSSNRNFDDEEFVYIHVSDNESDISKESDSDHEEDA
eukprot:gene33099-biopygen26242